MNTMPKTVDLSRGMSPEDFFVCSIPDRTKVEEWRESPEILDYRIPSSSWCAMTCISMVLLAEGLSSPTLEELFEQACDAEVYRPMPDDAGWSGAHHDKLPTFVATTLDQPVEYHPSMTTIDLMRALADGYYALLSVSTDIRLVSNEEPDKLGGHFVLVYGFEHDEYDNLFFVLNNGAGYATLNSQIGFRVSEERMLQVFSGRGVLVRSRHAP